MTSFSLRANHAKATEGEGRQGLLTAPELEAAREEAFKRLRAYQSDLRRLEHRVPGLVKPEYLASTDPRDEFLRVLNMGTNGRD